MCVCVCDFLTLLDGLRGSSARLSSKYRTDQRCFRTLCQNRKRNISRTSSQSDNAMPEKYPTLTLNVEHNQRMNNMINTAPSVHDMLHTNKHEPASEASCAARRTEPRPLLSSASALQQQNVKIIRPQSLITHLTGERTPRLENSLQVASPDERNLSPQKEPIWDFKTAE